MLEAKQIAIVWGDYEMCNVTYTLGKTERLLLELDYEVMDVTNQKYLLYQQLHQSQQRKSQKNLFPHLPGWSPLFALSTTSLL